MNAIIVRHHIYLIHFNLTRLHIIIESFITVLEGIIINLLA